MSDYDELSESIYQEACRIVGQLCFMLSENDAETDREQLVYQLQMLLDLMQEYASDYTMALEMALEQLSKK
ncbi:DUF2767 family protein [Pantoea agglomerans]|uniref:DUF2767 family protein n=1 Tax=Enterobacter agglomerans TaxID=549 RepID=UPI003DA184E4